MRSTSRSEKLDLRLSADDKRTLAAAAEHRSVSDFALRSALERENEALPDRQFFGLNSEKWTEFVEALDAPPHELPRISRLFREPSVLEIGDL